MFHIGICEDDPAAGLYEENLIRKWAEEHNRKISLRRFLSAESLLFSWEDESDYQLLILDIQMGEISGMDLARQLREKGYESDILFLTGVRDYALEGYEVGAIRYLLKPLKEAEFLKVVETVYNKAGQEEKECFLWEASGTVNRVEYEKILYAEARGHYVYLNTQKGEFQWKSAFSAIEDFLKDRGFFLLKRGLYVNLDHVDRITRTDCVMDNGELLPVARTRYKELNEAFIAYFRERSV